MARKREKTGGSSASAGGSGEGRPPGRQPGPEPGKGDAPHVPGWVPPTLFVLLTGWLFRDFIFSDRMLFGGDTLSLGYVARDFYAEMLKSGTFPFWNPELLGGTPFIEALSGGDSLYPPSALLLLLLEPYRALGWKLILHVVAAGFFMSGWVRSLGVSRPAALVAAVGYMLSPYLVSLVHPGHDGKLFVTALAPLLFWAVERHFARPGAGTFAGIGLVVAMVLLTTHFQMAYFLFGAVGLYAVFRAFQVGRGGEEVADAGAGEGDPQAAGAGRRRGLTPAGLRFGLFLAASVAGAAAAGVQFLPSASYVTEYSRRVQTTRAAAGETGRAWSSSWSLHPEEAMSLLIPEFAGNDAGGSAWTERTYWGRNATRDNLPIAGVVVLVLAAVSFAGAARRGVRWFLTGLGSAALLFALGEHTPVWGLFYALIPGIRLFRAPDMVMFLFVFSAATLASLAVDRILAAARDGRDKEWRPVLKVLGGAAAVMGLLAVLAASGALTSFWTRVVYSDVEEGRLAALGALQPFLVRGAFVAAVMTAAVGALAWGARKGVLAPAVLVWGLVTLVAVDQLRLDASFVQTLDFHEWSRPDPNIQTLLDRERGGEPYRLLSFVRAGQDVHPAMHGIELAAGHHPNDLARYRELIGMVGSGFPENLVNPNVRRLLNVRYILWPEWQLGPVGDQGVVSRTSGPGGQPYETLLAEPGLPRARLVGAASVVPDGQAVAYMLSSEFDPEREVVLSEAPTVPLGDGSPVAGEVNWLERSPNRLRLEVTSDRPALLVVADNWFPAWRATVDGAEAPVLRAYHTLRAVPVPAGASTVEMWYSSAELARAGWLSLVAFLVLGGLGVTGTVRRRWRAS